MLKKSIVFGLKVTKGLTIMEIVPKVLATFPNTACMHLLMFHWLAKQLIFFLLPLVNLLWSENSVFSIAWSGRTVCMLTTGVTSTHGATNSRGLRGFPHRASTTSGTILRHQTQGTGKHYNFRVTMSSRTDQLREQGRNVSKIRP